MSRVAHVTTGLVAQREESAALRHGVTKPGPVLPRSTPYGPVPREEGGGGAVPRVSTDDSPNIRDDSSHWGAGLETIFFLGRNAAKVAVGEITFYIRRAARSGPRLSQRPLDGPWTPLHRKVLAQGAVRAISRALDLRCPRFYVKH